VVLWYCGEWWCPEHELREPLKTELNQLHHQAAELRNRKLDLQNRQAIATNRLKHLPDDKAALEEKFALEAKHLEEER
jgi:predicted nuclease with TOPRIM domain